MQVKTALLTEPIVQIGEVFKKAARRRKRATMVSICLVEIILYATSYNDAIDDLIARMTDGFDFKKAVAGC